MLVVRAEQLEAFRRAALERFATQVEAHIRTFFPAEAARLGADGVRSRILGGVEKGARYGLVGAAEVAQLIDLMFAFGHDFDVDPTMRWARLILQGTASPQEKMELLTRAALRIRAVRPETDPGAPAPSAGG